MASKKPDKQELTEKALENLALQLSAAERNLQSISSGPSSVAGSEERDILIVHQDGTSKQQSGSLKGSSGDRSSRGNPSSNSSAERAEGGARPAALEPGSVDVLTCGSSSADGRKSGTFESSGVKSAASGTSGDSVGKGGSKGIVGSNSSSSSGTGFDPSEVLALLREEMRIEAAGKLQADAELASLRLAMEKMAARQSAGMSDISKQLLKSRAQSTEDDTKIVELQQQIVDVNKEEQILQSRISRRAAKQERKDDAERIASWKAYLVQLKAEQEQRIANLHQQAKDESVAAHDAMIDAKASADAALQASQDSVHILQEELARNQQVKLDAQIDTSEVQMELDSMAVEHAAKLEELNKSLEATKMELRHQDKIDEAKEPSVDGGQGDQMVQLSAMLLASRTEQHAMAIALRDLRLQLLGVRQDKSAAVGDMQSLLDEANRNLEMMQSAGSNRSSSMKPNKFVRGRKPQPMVGSLASIEEESDDEGSFDGSIGASGVVSSHDSMHDDADVVADLADFDENDPKDRSLLHTELANERRAHANLKELMASRSDANSEWIRQLQEALQQSEKERDLAREDLRALQSDAREDAVKDAAQNDSLQLLLNEAKKKLHDQKETQVYNQQLRAELQSGIVRKEAENENLRQQLSYAIAATKNAELRLEDLKHEVESSKRRQLSIETTLQRELLVAQAQQFAAGGEDGSDAVSNMIETETRAVHELKEEVCNTGQERRNLAKRLEGKEMQWKDQVRSLEESHAQALAELKRQFEMDKQAVQHEQNERVQELQDRLGLALQRLSNLKEGGHASPALPAPQQPPQISRRLLKCPSRILKDPSSGPPAGVVIAPCRYVVWRVVGLVTDSIALLCNSLDFEILEASKRACSIWGSASLHGHSLMSLVQSPMRAAWMKSKINEAHTGMGPVPGFIVKDLQCMELQSKKGSFDASVVVAHLPDEPGKPSSMLAIFEQLSKTSAQQHQEKEQHHSRGARLSRRGGSSPPQSAASSVVSLNPSDSVSCVAEKMFFDRSK